MSEELLPCPFCGSKIPDPEAADIGWWVECIKCEIVMDRISKRDLINSWNTRTQPLIPSDDRHVVMVRSDKGCPRGE